MNGYYEEEESQSPGEAVSGDRPALNQYLARLGSASARWMNPSQGAGTAPPSLYRPPSSGMLNAPQAQSANGSGMDDGARPLALQMPGGINATAESWNGVSSASNNSPGRLTLLRHSGVEAPSMAWGNSISAQTGAAGRDAMGGPPRPAQGDGTQPPALRKAASPAHATGPAKSKPAAAKIPKPVPKKAQGVTDGETTAVDKDSPLYNLVHAQDVERTDKRNWSKAETGEEGKQQTYCNIATYHIAESMGAPLGPLQTTVTGADLKMYPQGFRPGLANEMFDALAKSKEYKTVTADEAQELANQGKLVIAALRAKGHGHVATVRPSNLTRETAPTIGIGPVMNHIGQSHGVYRRTGAFGGTEPIYYTPVEGGSKR